MKTIRKILSVVLSMVMLVSVCTLFSNAAVIDATTKTGTENAAKINVKYTVEQVATVGSYTAVNNNVYKVSVYAKAAYGLQYFQVPIYYDNSKFEVIMDSSSADPIGDGTVLYNGYASDAGESAIYAFDKGTAWSDTSMYKSDYVSVATTKAQARYIGLGSTNATTVAPQWEAHDATSATYSAWTTPTGKSNCGIAFMCLDNLGNSKNAYFNAYEAKVNTDWVLMGSIYFIRLTGVSEASVIGAEFGAYDGGNGLEGLWDTSGNPSYFGTTYAEAEPGLNIVSNAVVKAAGPSVAKSKAQVKMTITGPSTVADAFDLRVISTISDADWSDYFAHTYTGSTETTDIITSVGMVTYDNSGTFSTSDATNAACGVAVEGYKAAETTYINHTTGSAATFGTIVKFSTAPAKDVTYIGFVKYLDSTGTAKVLLYPAELTAAIGAGSNYDSVVSRYIAANS